MEDRRVSPKVYPSQRKVYRSNFRFRRRKRIDGGASFRPGQSDASDTRNPIPVRNSCDVVLNGQNRNNNSTEQVGSSSMDCAVQPLTPGQKLIAAIKSGNMQTAVHLLNQHQPGGGDHCISQNCFQTALLEACRAGQKFLVQQLVRAGTVVNMRENTNCTTALHIAAQLGFVDIADFLLSNHATVDALDRDLNTAMILAVNSAGCTDMLNLLLAYGAKVHFQNSEGTTALMKAVQVMDIDAIRMLLRAGSDLKLKNKKRQTARDIAVKLGISDVFDSSIFETELDLEDDPIFPYPLTKAALEGCTGAVRILLDSRYLDIEGEMTEKYEEGKDVAKSVSFTKLIDALCSEAKRNKNLDRKKLEIAQILIASGARPFQDDRFGLNSPLHEATQAGVYDLVKIICSSKYVKPNVLKRDRTALMIAAEQGRVDILKLLLSINADVKMTARSWDTALSVALNGGQVGSAEVLLQSYKPPERELQRMAIKLVENGKAETLKFLASHCNISDISQSLLEKAVKIGSTETVKTVVDAGVDINMRCCFGETALVVALRHLKAPHVIDMVTFLVENGASVNKGTSAESPLVHALAHKSCLQYLLEKGADVNEVGDYEGNTPLLAALDFIRPCFSHSDNVDIVEILLEAGADPNFRNRLGKTVLHLAAFEGKTGIVQQLLTAGADLEARDTSGHTPLCVAVDRGQSGMIALLKKCGANMSVVDDDGNTALLHLLETRYKPQEEAVRLLACDRDRDYLNKRQKDGLTSLMLAAKNRGASTVRILLELGADPNIVDNSSGKSHTALSFIMDNFKGTRKSLSCSEMLIQHKGLTTLPTRCNSALHQAIMDDQRQLVQLMVTHGMAPVTVHFPATRILRNSIWDNVRRNLTPLAAALIKRRLVVARYLLENWFLNPLDLVGSQQLKELRVELEKLNDHDSLNFLDEHLSQPMSLEKLSFVTVSALLGEVAGREERVRMTPLPLILQDKLLFLHEMFPLDLEQENEPIVTSDDDVEYDDAYSDRSDSDDSLEFYTSESDIY